ncbi:hypothetical protein [Mycolicibacterium litorale]|uniref:Uncharacterized protein n=1 Tax=Mycolicibacterium litorale TaxID=758802 RepID=A0AAD1ILX8_9MYCO|nr:hypothetical protein [Mycolicibacterium litorale]MCV7416007.1 hypothetical protein [Mycolicibacterium litorale]TDY09261.1 hypothetical protein BCL50_1349 [Mycolicibacterium litorale]BBY17201.1 hypothetical protein MLIT_27930 [Mycolicibacterium litorale]
MSPQPFTPADITDALVSRRRKGHGLSVPYARKWEVGGCQAVHSLHDYPYNGIDVLSEGLVRLGRPLFPTEYGVAVGEGTTALWVAINRSTRGEGPPDAYLLGRHNEETAQYTGNTPEVVIKLLEQTAQPVVAMPMAEELQVGFPGLPDRGVTYVGSWQWDVHGEARGDEFVLRAAVATLAAIESKRATDAH